MKGLKTLRKPLIYIPMQYVSFESHRIAENDIVSIWKELSFGSLQKTRLKIVFAILFPSLGVSGQGGKNRRLEH